MRTNKKRVLVAACLASGLFAGQAHADSLYYSGGFEPAQGFTAGGLSGQSLSDGPIWKYATTLPLKVGASQVRVENSMVYQGSDAVEFNRSGADMDTYYAPVFNTSPAIGRYVNVSWEMNVAVGATSDPFFGIYAYNGDYTLGYAGVDATTGMVQYSQASTGYLTNTRTFVSVGGWNSFDMQLDYQTQTQTLFVNGLPAYTQGFIDAGQTGFTDGDVVSFASNLAQTGTGIVYYDSYAVSTTSSAFVAPSYLTWQNTGGGDGHTWDVGSTANFNNGTSSTAYRDGDYVTFNDANNGNYSVVINSVVSPGALTVSNSAGDYTFSGSGGISGVTSLVKNGTGNLTLSTSNSYTGGTTVNGGTLTLAAANAFPANTYLNISSGAKVVEMSHGSSPVTAIWALTLSNNGVVDVTDNDLIITSGSLASVTQQLKSGYGGGTWHGSTGIVSSTAAADSSHLTAVGSMVNDDGSGNHALYGIGAPLGLFDGFNPADGAILVKYTYYGDTNLDGKIDGTDYSRIDSGFFSQATGWYNGDFNYDGVIDGLDYTLIDNAFNMQGSALSSSGGAALTQIAAVSTVPEPSSLVMMGLATVATLGRFGKRDRVSIR